MLLQIVIEDETTGNGSRTLVERGYTADGVLICDGTWSEQIVYAHLGQVWLDVHISGEPVAACVENRGVNPIYIAISFVGKLKEFISGLNDKPTASCFHGIDRANFVNIGKLDFGVWAGSVPAKARMLVQIGFSDVFQPDEVVEFARKIAIKCSERITVSESLLKTPSFSTNPGNPLITCLKARIERNSRKEVRVIPVTGHCDMRHFGTSEICLYGPGGEKKCSFHQRALFPGSDAGGNKEYFRFCPRVVQSMNNEPA